MAAQKTIAIIGASGKMGNAIAKSLVHAGYRLLLMAKKQEKLQVLFDELIALNSQVDAEVMVCPVDASWEADVIILAIPYAAEAIMAEKIKQVATGKIVISISNPLNAAYDGLVTDPSSSAAEELQKLLPYSKVIKAFNTNFSADYAQPEIAGKTVDSFIAANDAEAIHEVSEIVAASGFNPIVAGNLATARILENMTVLLMSLNKRYHFNGLAGWKILHN